MNLRQENGLPLDKEVVKKTIMDILNDKKIDFKVAGVYPIKNMVNIHVKKGKPFLLGPGGKNVRMLEEKLGIKIRVA